MAFLEENCILNVLTEEILAEIEEINRQVERETAELRKLLGI